MAGCLGLYRGHVVAIWEACLAILGWYGRERVGLATRIGWSGLKVWVLLCGLGGPGHNVWVLPRGLGVLWT
jgi:hypothetical protein